MARLEFVERRSDSDNEFLEDIRCTVSGVCLDDSSLSQGKELFLWRLVDSQGGKWYWGTKSFVHNFALSACESLHLTRVQEYEIAPPLVKTAMSGQLGVECDVYCADVVSKLRLGEKEIGYALSEQVRLADRGGQVKITGRADPAND